MSFPRLRASLAIAFSFLMAITVAIIAVLHDSQADADVGAGCPKGMTEVRLTLPKEAGQVKLRIINGTRTEGLAVQVSEEFKNRGFAVQKPLQSANELHADIAVIYFGPETVGAAQWIQAFFLGEATSQFNRSRTGDVIDVTLGDRYRELASTTEVNQAMAQLGEPKLPPGTCRTLR
ncbi:LytR C-terminal domain-containing protein [Actinoplanes sp. TFC3]|uniref:LytR C-terminal domain-containing protein n=1 Tax=Actinoplanes sp. TFC3 TaxID=1710355 RepID=UPI00137B1C36|nr:LytR C-terminal domain-containing protein [Actinoplanes sp. TFC3]